MYDKYIISKIQYTYICTYVEKKMQRLKMDSNWIESFYDLSIKDFHNYYCLFAINYYYPMNDSDSNNLRTRFDRQLKPHILVTEITAGITDKLMDQNVNVRARTLPAVTWA